MLSQNQPITHPQYGNGIVLADQGELLLVDFGGKIERVRTADVQVVRTVEQAIADGRMDDPLRTITRLQAEAITSANAHWGVFTRSRIALLPHQLWVCRKALERWPVRLMIADDVGLGKTIEAGLILMALQARGLARRVLILAPASLVPQWQERLRELFDLRFDAYLRESDTPRSDYWNSHDRVIASFQTLRMKGDAQKRLQEAEPWDVILADEAHHLGADEERGPTLGFRLVESLQKANRLRSLLFFTGTPHRGKAYGFLSLMHLIAPDRFNPRQNIAGQFAHLREHFIRNNKQNTTDLRGNRLFFPPVVTSETYHYSEAESAFYQLLSEFILTGRAYAKTLGERDSRAVMLVLITMQKLASSSVEAVRRALRGRCERLRKLAASSGTRPEPKAIGRESMQGYMEDAEWEDLDASASAEERLAEEALALALMEDELPRLEELVRASELVTSETKMAKLMEMVEGRLSDRPILFFTEYKATQSLLLGELIRRFGIDEVAFINGDAEARDVAVSPSARRTLRMSREEAADRFNSGRARFLVSTEAGGEGIDLQERCWTLVHVDLPWNPMRMHQRVGRLNRYGQKRPVEVISLRNPDTVEDRIWQILNAKIASIMTAFGSAMDDPEDLFQLVLGTAPSAFYMKLFSEASYQPRERLSDWFDRKTATFSGRDSVELVKEMLGRADRFDFQSVSAELPRADLPDLEPFFVSVLQLHGRRIAQEPSGIRLETPEAWRQEIGIDRQYEGLHFERQRVGRAESKRLLGSGHRLFDLALREAMAFREAVTALRHLKQPILVVQVVDALSGGVAAPIVLGIRIDIRSGRTTEVLRDWELLKALNDYTEKEGRPEKAAEPADLGEPPGCLVESIRAELLTVARQIAPQLQMPEIRLLGAVLSGRRP
jgi:superfamily II DNA or RNA helicase